MGKLTQQLLFVSMLAFLVLAQGAQPALASDADVASTSGFGASVATSGPSTFSVPSNWSATLNESVFLGGGIYTYVFTLLNAATSAVGLSSSSTATLGSPNLDNFSNLLNWGVVTGSTTSGVDDKGFTFNPNSTIVAFASGTGCSGTNAIGCTSSLLPKADQITFYLQSAFGPVPGTFGAIDGGTVASTSSLDPGPEPSTILLFGTGLLVLGALVRRRLPQLPQPL
jgi:hypothetical protein